MQLRNSLRELSARIAEQRDEVQTEEATKRTFVLPFLAALGYNVYDPTQVTWGLGTDGESPQGKTVDYTIWSDGQPIMVIECRHHDTDLAAGRRRCWRIPLAAQGPRSACSRTAWRTSSTPTRKEAGVMDAEPFWTYDVLDSDDEAVEQLKNFARTSFDRNHVVHSAREAGVYTRHPARAAGADAAAVGRVPAAGHRPRVRGPHDPRRERAAGTPDTAGVCPAGERADQRSPELLPGAGAAVAHVIAHV